ncbi:MAG: RcnB family protein [Luteimonas sp.]
MKRSMLTVSIAALLLSSLFSLTAAADRGHGRGHDNDRYDQDYDRHRDDHRYGDHDDHDGRNDRDWRDDHDRDDHYRHDNGRHLGWQKHDFRRGQRVPVVYLQPRYYVNDYRAYRLAPPPRGYRWVRPDDGGYLLVQATTGLIAQILGY